MVAISENAVWTPVTRIEPTTVALGGDEVNSPNLQLKQLVDRTKWLYDNTSGGLSSVATDGSLTGNGTSESPLSVVAVDVSPIPVGVIMPFGGFTAPTGYLLCRGQELNNAEYPALFAVLGNTYGGSVGITFMLPDLRVRMPIGANDTTYNVGNTGGSETHTLTVDEMPSHTHATDNHNHTVNDPGHVHSLNPYFRDNAVAGGADGDELTRAGTVTSYPDTSSATTGITLDASNVTVQNTGTGQAHNNMSPYIVLNYIIKV